jgi:tRNA A37 N6-isopentenylltransferase MiaA
MKFRFNFSRDDHKTDVSLSVPNAALQKALLILTGGSTFWLSSHLPMLWQKLNTLPDVQTPPAMVRSERAVKSN